MDQGHRTDEKRMRLRYAGSCRVCDVVLPAGSPAVFERSSKTVRCVTHVGPSPAGPEPAPLDVGVPGASARREFERRKASREQRVRTRHPRIGGLLHALSDEPQSTKAWDVGALGEERLGNRLSALASDELLVLHDRRIPGSRANIDHLVVTPTGVYVIDAKKYTGRPHLKIEGGLVRPRVEKLMVGSRDCTKLIDGVLKQVEIVQDVVADLVPVHGVLCFVDADWPLIGGSFSTRGVQALSPRKLCRLLAVQGPSGIAVLRDQHRALAAALPPA